MNKHLLVETLQNIRFLHDVSREHLEELASVATFRDYDELDVVFREGDVADHVYLVVFGNVSLEICAPGVGCKRVMTIGPGELLGWSAFLEQARMSATARVMETTRLVQFDAAQLLTLCERDLQFGYEITRRAMLAVAKRLSATRMQLIDVYGHKLPAAVHANEE